MRKRASVTRTVAAPPQSVFALVTDVDRLPEWNAGMTRVVERPDPLTPGSEWVVELRAMGQTWRSRSRVEELDPAGRVFRYRSGTDDANPSYAVWEWQVDGDGAAATVTVSWELHPATFWRKVVLAPVRHRQLRRAEVPASIAALSRVLATTG
ncbi:MAG TPA: SRPBCC family protein [Acidimicrobiia bacterium]|nr:SRPBCC family protein [Acidimicrobiia bacterium]